jgi:hypothetical protein
MVLSQFNAEAKGYTDVQKSQVAEQIRIRALFFEDDGTFVIRFWNPGSKRDSDERGKTVQRAVQWFFDDVLQHVFGLE